MHENLVQKIIARHFAESPRDLIRKPIGLCNEVYEAVLAEQSVIVRIGVNSDNLKGSGKFIPIFKSLKILVPDILAEDYSRELIPYPYQILTKLEGNDLVEVIQDMSRSELDGVAKEIASILQKLSVLPTNGKFGWFCIDDSGITLKSQTDVVRTDIQGASAKMQNSGIYSLELAEKVQTVYQKYETYFQEVSSTLYFDDLNSKNVMVNNGVFTGLVDIDGMVYGDPLNAVGAMRANWPNTSYGDFYINTVMDALDLSSKQRSIVDAYAVFHRYSWMAENGQLFNANTRPGINTDKLEKDKRALSLLINKVL